MKNKPQVLLIISMLYFLSPLSVFAQVMYMAGLPILSFYKAVYYFNWHSYVLIISGPIVGYGIYRVREWGFYLFIYHAMFLIINNTVIFFGHFSAFPWYVYVLCNVVVIGLIGLLLRKEIYAPYFNPKIRWWEQAKRFFPPSDLQYSVSKDGELIKSELGDISLGGVYLISDAVLKVGDRLDFNFIIEGQQELKTESVVVWVHYADSLGVPTGIGCMFFAPDKKFVTSMKNFFRKVNAKVKRY